MGGKYRLVTLGCKVNQYESQQIREVVERSGYSPAGNRESADLAIVNTCAVTSSALRQSRAEVRKLAKVQPVVVVGCGASADAKQFNEIDGVRAVWGHDHDVIADLNTLLRESRTPGQHRDNREALSSGADWNERWMIPERPQAARLTVVKPDYSLPIISPDPPPVKQPAELVSRIEAFAGHRRAFLKVQDGCDAYCSYCIIPQLRPHPRSKPIEVAVAEARGLVAAGHLEIVVTGIFLGAYGHETAIRKRWSQKHHQPLVRLIEALAQVPNLKRLRLSSLEPGDVTDDLLQVMARHETCVPHLHLPLQSGSATILKAMNRQYSREDFLEMIHRVNKSLNVPAISTDMIVGFPGETDADFEATIDAAQVSQFIKIHAFPFSPREHTAAARWSKKFVPEKKVRERMEYLSELEQELSQQFRAKLVGFPERVLIERVERSVAREDSVIASGHADRFFEINFEASADVNRGEVVPVRITSVSRDQTWGCLLTPGRRTWPLQMVH